MGQTELKLEAERIVDHLGILRFLSAKNCTKIVGSSAFGLIVKKDIDIHVLTDSSVDEIAKEAIGFLIDKQTVNFTYLDFRGGKEAILISIDHVPGPTGLWKIDIWITNDYDLTGFPMIDYMREKLTGEFRNTILELKAYYNDKKLLHNGLSTQIYYAVIEHNVKTADDFEKHLQTVGWELK